MTMTVIQPSRQTTTRGVSLAVAGAGEPVVLLHGIGGNAGSCGPLAAQLADSGYATHAWDAVGYGESADPVGTEVEHAAELVAVIEELGTGPVHLFGTSWGGVVAAEAAAGRPDLVRSLVLADSTRGSATSPERAAAMRARVEELGRLGAPAFAAARAPRLVAPGCPPDIAAGVEADMAQVRLPGYAAAAEHMARTDVAGLLPTLTVPTLVLVGAQDNVTGVPESELIARLVPGARLVVVPDAGHAALQERPAEIAAHVCAFWQEVAP
jgi:pimeloyl-ACP methyl ester carboxylesterase